MSFQDALQQLRRLDGSSPEFRDQLSNVLNEEGYAQWVPNIQGDDLMWLIDHLDKALDALDPASPAFQKCLYELRCICVARTILPPSCTLSSQLLDVGRQPVASEGSGDLYEGTLNGSKVRVKRVRLCSKDGSTKTTKAFYHEAVVWKHLEHRKIVPLLCITSTPLQLISEWVPDGDLTAYINKHPGADRPSLLSDVAEGLHFLHSCDITHGDLKGRNVLVDPAGHARITDFGLAPVTQNLDFIRSGSDDQGFTARWTAPEILNESGTFGKEADVFSFAMVMIEVFTGAVPFGDSSPVVAMLAIKQGERPQRPTHPALTEGLWSLMRRCWNHDPRSRPEALEVLQILLTDVPPAWKRLISRSFSVHDRISLITSIFLDRNEVKVVERLTGDDAQSFIDVISEMLDNLSPQTHRECLRYLYKICGRQALVPRSLAIPLCYDTNENPVCHGGFADIWKGQHRGQDVAAKVLRVYLNNDFEQTKRMFCREVVTWKALRHPNVLPLLGVTMVDTRLVMVSKWMVNSSIDKFVKMHADADRLELLADATRGLIFLHDQGIIHGDLKPANILINHDGRACLADFGLLTIVADQSTTTSSTSCGGTIRWMSPELLFPDSFGLKHSRLTRESDCYALGMVVYEVLSGQMPFALYRNTAVIFKVLHGERPEKPRGAEAAWFTDDLWRMLELCWKHQPGDRISARDVLLCLEGGPLSSLSSVSHVDGGGEWSDAMSSDSSPSISRGLVPPLSRLVIIDTSLPTTRSEAELPTTPDYLSDEASPLIQSDGGELLAPPRGGGSKEGWAGRMARNVRKVFKVISRKLSGL